MSKGRTSPTYEPTDLVDGLNNSTVWILAVIMVFWSVLALLYIYLLRPFVWWGERLYNLKDVKSPDVYVHNPKKERLHAAITMFMCFIFTFSSIFWYQGMPRMLVGMGVSSVLYTALTIIHYQNRWYGDQVEGGWD